MRAGIYPRLHGCGRGHRHGPTIHLGAKRPVQAIDFTLSATGRSRRSGAARSTMRLNSLPASFDRRVASGSRVVSGLAASWGLDGDTARRDTVR